MNKHAGPEMSHGVYQHGLDVYRQLVTGFGGGHAPLWREIETFVRDISPLLPRRGLGIQLGRVSPEPVDVCFHPGTVVDVCLGPDEGAVESMDICARPEWLPVCDGSVRRLILDFTLAWCQDPHAVLREAERVLEPGGVVLLLGIHPWGVWGAARCALPAALRMQGPWAARMLSLFHVLSWLEVLGFEVHVQRRFFCCMPLGRPLSFWPRPARNALDACFGNVFGLVARKQVAGVMPITPRWMHQPSWAGASFSRWRLPEQDHSSR